MQTPARLVAAVVVSLSVLATSACGDSGEDKASDASSAATTSDGATTDGATSDAPAPSGEECAIDDITVEGAFGSTPTITVPDDCTPPVELLSKDLVTGSGPAAEAGDTVETNYHLVTWSNKQVLDSSFERGQTFPLEDLGNAPVIDGWNQGLIGIQEGTRRLLVIPPDLGYGQGGQGVEPNETLVFVVDAVSVS
ncbi:FKBP-type peptidyl-prolyl cis-trans isomerase [Nocardioides sp. BYT-33-1]|uniref:FKBP-type peptidyl-prolyl cis-trans isomerase n=1 Tax=Nocardioides sp. BYT-33-1 TaxID=3416952 RepID=UPI003F532D6A